MKEQEIELQDTTKTEIIEIEKKDIKEEKKNENHDNVIPVNYFDFTPEFSFLDIKTNENNDTEDDGFVIVEKLPIPQLDLSLLDTKQHDQKNVLFGKSGKLFFYDVSLLKEVFKKFSSIKYHGLRALFRYVPKKINTSKKPIVSFIIHGTWGNTTEGYYKPNTPLMNNYLKYLAEKAEEEDVYVDLYSFEWPATNDDTTRIYAGMLLGYILNSIMQWYHYFMIFAFSHGVNVGLVACNQLEGFALHEFVAVAPPVLENGAWFYAPHNIENFSCFFSVDDAIRWFGYTWSVYYDNACTNYKNLCNKGLHEDPFDERGHIYKNSCSGSVINVRYKFDNYDPGHSETPNFLALHLYEIMKNIRTNFMHNDTVRNLSLNIVPHERIKKNTYALCNISLYPQSEEEEKRYALKLPLKILYLSEKNKEDHYKIYGYAKDEKSTFSSIYGYITKLFK